MAIYNATGLPARDTVLTMLDIRYTRWDLQTRTFKLRAQASLPWMQSIRNGILPTGYAPIDSLFEYLHFTLDYYDTNNGNAYHNLFLVSDSNLNTTPLNQYYSSLPGIDFLGSYTQFIVNDQAVSDSLFPAFTQLIFRYGWDDCWSGCIYNRYWSFNVYPDCKVEYAGSYGDALPASLEVSPPAGLQPSAKVWPNPFSESLYLEVSEPGRIYLYNATGSKVCEAPLNIGVQHLDGVALLPPRPVLVPNPGC